LVWRQHSPILRRDGRSAQNVEYVDEQRGVRGLVPRQPVEQVARPRHHKREDQSIGLGKRERTLDCS
jgi:hypothetical protein